ncbi:hypothetical protein VI817_004278 [Penicillium citrinum]|nr:hypothetical protein VI817_004278 [Penicillium citrinum]
MANGKTMHPEHPSRETSKAIDATVEAIQSKLAGVTINDRSLAPSREVEVQEHAEDHKPKEQDDKGAESQSTGGPSSHVSEPQNTFVSADTSTEQSSKESSDEIQNHQTIEVRVPGQSSQRSNGRASKEIPPITKERTVKKKPDGRRSSGFVHDPHLNTYVAPILKEALSPIASQSIQRFGAWASKSAKMFHVEKLAEGSYGEVYKLHLREESARPMVSKSKLAKLRMYGDGVFKVVPLNAPRGPGSKKFTSVEEIVSEARMLKYLDPIPGFARFREIHVVQGRFPEPFQEAWDYYKETKDDCMNPNPASKKSYPDTQLWAIVEMDDAGCELEKFSWSSIFQIYDIFWGVAMALARAEEYAMFEHRDLHLGNVCIRSTRSNGSMEPPSALDIVRNFSPSGFGTSSIETTIIDYSLSRANLLLADLPDESEGVVEIASSDLDKKQIFDAVGEDEDEALLRDTYRYMRATLYTGEPSQTQKCRDIPGIWAEYAPRTNLVWLLFLLKNLLKNRKPEPVEHSSTMQPARQALAVCSPNRKTTIRTLDSDKSTKTQVQANTEPLAKEHQSKGMQNKIAKLKQTLEDRMQAVLELLDLEKGHEDMCCAADLVAYAMDSQWLVEQDFF